MTKAQSKTKYPQYDSYKESGVEWLDMIPNGWDVQPLKRITSLNRDSLSEKTEGGREINYVDVNSVSSEGKILATQELRFRDAPSRARRVVHEGDTIISTVRTYLRAIAYIESNPGNLIVSTGFAVLEPSPELHPKYLFYLVSSEYFIAKVVSRSVGVNYPAIPPTEVGTFKVPKPPKDTQQRIATFLDEKTDTIDTLVRKNKRLIELLKERRQTIISNAVTKGLEGSKKMKKTGVEWIGSIPRGWDCYPLRAIVRNKTKKGSEDVDLPYLSLEHIKKDLGHLDSSVEIDEKPSKEYYLFYEGDVLFGKLRPYLHKYLYAYFDGCAVTDILVLHSAEWVNNKFFFYILHTRYFLSLADATSYGVKMPRTGWEYLKAYYLPVPDKEEQQKVVDYLDKETEKIDSAINKIERENELLHEYRQSLILSAVTGKIKV